MKEKDHGRHFYLFIYTFTVCFIIMGGVKFPSLFVSDALCQEIYVEGEGYVTPTAKSQEPLDISQIKTGERAANDSIAINIVSDQFPKISVYATAIKGGQYATGLTRNDFLLSEQSTLESSPAIEYITDFTEQTGSGTGSGITFCLVFDISGSMCGSRLANAKLAATDFMNNCQSNDRGSLVSFDDVANIVKSVNWVNSDANRNGIYDIIESINSLTCDGSTAVYDGTGLGLQTLTQEPQPKAIIVFSDGETNSDRNYSLTSIIDSADNQGVKLYTIGLGIDNQNMKDMAANTGGEYYYAPTAGDMAAIYSTIAGDLRSQYVMSYTSHNSTYDGTTRTVRLTNDNITGQQDYIVNYKPVIHLDNTTEQLSNSSQIYGQDLTISGTITDMDAVNQNLNTKLWYRHVGSSTSFSSVNLTLTSMGSGSYAFSGIIPGTIVKEPGVEYYLYATDGLLETYSPFNYQTVPYSIPVIANYGPKITHTAISESCKDQSITITATVADQNVDDTISRVELFYREHNNFQTTPYYTLEMTLSGTSQYSVNIPSTLVSDAGVDYFIAAWDSNAVRTDHGSSFNPHYIDIIECNNDIQLILSSSSGGVGGTVTLDLELGNTTNTSVAAISTDIDFDSAIFESYPNDESNAKNPLVVIGAAGAAASKDVSYNLLDSNTLRVSVVSTNRNAIPNGIVASITFYIKSTTINGTTTDLFHTPSGSDTNANNVNIDGIKGSVVINDCKLGDCNCDGTVSIAEVQSAIKMHIGKKAVERCCDLNNDNNVSITEVQLIINNHLGIVVTSRSHTTREKKRPAQMNFERVSDGYSLSLLSNRNSLSGLSIDITYPVELADKISFELGASAEFAGKELIQNQIQPVTSRIAVISTFDNQAIDDGEILFMQINEECAEANVSFKVTASDEAGEAIEVQ